MPLLAKVLNSNNYRLRAVYRSLDFFQFSFFRKEKNIKYFSKGKKVSVKRFDIEIFSNCSSTFLSDIRSNSNSCWSCWYISHWERRNWWLSVLFKHSNSTAQVLLARIRHILYLNILRKQFWLTLFWWSSNDRSLTKKRSKGVNETENRENEKLRKSCRRREGNKRKPKNKLKKNKKRIKQMLKEWAAGRGVNRDEIGGENGCGSGGRRRVDRR